MGLAVTIEEMDLLAAIKELVEASRVISSGGHHSATDIERYQKALGWADNVIERAERSERYRYASSRDSCSTGQAGTI